MRIIFLVIVLLASICGFVHSLASPKGLKISLAAKWPATPLLHEAAEFLVRVSAIATLFYITPVFENNTERYFLSPPRLMSLLNYFGNLVEAGKHRQNKKQHNAALQLQIRHHIC
jgi:hypothetical protein